jgi:biofilm PGA synthesis protein PgaD
MREDGMFVARPADARRPLIIQREDLQTWAQRYGYLSMTFLFWFLWLYLFVPLLALVAWALGATLVYQVMIHGLDTADLNALLRSYGGGAGLLSAIYLLWAIVSWLRFRNVERRRTPATVSDETLAASHHLTSAELDDLRRGHRQVISAEQLTRMFAPGPPRDVPDDEVFEPPRSAAGG